ncbi:neural-cadherin-like [Frankliniella occidentalis]|uniref:Neural-cadherin-like n=1 Tax=Frankliniella occidentalis TaxID=133901 RepID=A0A9C6WYC0_FRAOC|nr:neural-cadherin-like [Frankliniella occidentalis]
MTGAIYVAGALDYETRKRYELRLTASDNLRENYTTVVIHVKDVNDNPPVFERPTYQSQITEEDDRALPKQILKVTATDGDQDRPQNIVYFLTGQGIDPDNPANSKFDINKTTGDIYVLKVSQSGSVAGQSPRHARPRHATPHRLRRVCTGVAMRAKHLVVIFQEGQLFDRSEVCIPCDSF